jgi:hypothetical protein
LSFFLKYINDWKIRWGEKERKKRGRKKKEKRKKERERLGNKAKRK